MSWRLIFVINLPIAAAVVAVTARHVPESRDPGVAGPVDVPGGVLATAGLIGLTYGLVEGPADGWDRAPVLAALAAGAGLVAARQLFSKRDRGEKGWGLRCR